MAIALGGLIGAASRLQSSFGDSTSLKTFLERMTQVGIQIKSRFEANFSGIPDFTFFLQDIQMPGVVRRTGTLYFGGKTVDIPILEEFDHNLSLTIINDSSGYIYSALKNIVMNGLDTQLTPSGYTITVRAIGDNKTPGMTLNLNGVRIINIGGLSFGQSQNEYQTFTVECWIKDFDVTPGAVSKIAGVAGSIKGLLC